MLRHGGAAALARSWHPLETWVRNGTAPGLRDDTRGALADSLAQVASNGLLAYGDVLMELDMTNGTYFQLQSEVVWMASVQHWGLRFTASSISFTASCANPV
eukprot:13561728-Alexandrium_andersonii.AAC.1